MDPIIDNDSAPEIRTGWADWETLLTLPGTTAIPYEQLPGANIAIMEANVIQIARPSELLNEDVDEFETYIRGQVQRIISDELDDELDLEPPKYTWARKNNQNFGALRVHCYDSRIFVVLSRSTFRSPNIIDRETGERAALPFKASHLVGPAGQRHNWICAQIKLASNEAAEIQREMAEDLAHDLTRSRANQTLFTISSVFAQRIHQTRQGDSENSTRRCTRASSNARLS